MIDLRKNKAFPKPKLISLDLEAKKKNQEKKFKIKKKKLKSRKKKLKIKLTLKKKVFFEDDCRFEQEVNNVRRRKRNACARSARHWEKRGRRKHAPKSIQMLLYAPRERKRAEFEERRGDGVENRRFDVDGMELRHCARERRRRLCGALLQNVRF